MRTYTPIERPDRKSDINQEIKRYLVKRVFATLMLAAILILSSGRLEWVMGWVLVGVYFAWDSVVVLILIPKSPGLIAERAKYQKGTKAWDVVIASLAAALVPMATWIVAGLDVRFGTAQIPLAFQIAALAIAVLGFALVTWAMASNEFFSVTVRIQKDRGHTVATGGPYQYVRHPGYVGAIAFQLATPIMLGSLWAFIPAVLSVPFYVIRAALEDKTLQNELDGYQDYAARVRYRLLPGIW